MKSLKLIKNALFIMLCMMFIFLQSALAYVDPATTSYVIQAVAGVVLLGGAAVGIYWHKIKRAFKKRRMSKNPEVIEDEEE